MCTHAAGAWACAWFNLMYSLRPKKKTQSYDSNFVPQKKCNPTSLVPSTPHIPVFQNILAQVN
jgi:hypothetical protein